MVSAALRPAAVDVRITEMRARHLRGVMAIEEAVYPRPWSSQLFVAELERRSDRCYLVALAPSSDRWRRRRVVGYAGAMIVPGHTDRDAHVTTLATDPSEHRRKIGTRLLLHLLREVLARGAEAATLEVRTTNPGAQRLYRGFGFAPVGVRPGYYSETGEDAVIMWAHDIQARMPSLRGSTISKPAWTSPGAPPVPRTRWFPGSRGAWGSGGSSRPGPQKKVRPSAGPRDRDVL
jgi:[ribosomal protein S18]-alanine N-acetyltransferase